VAVFLFLMHIKRLSFKGFVVISVLIVVSFHSQQSFKIFIVTLKFTVVFQHRTVLKGLSANLLLEFLYGLLHQVDLK